MVTQGRCGVEGAVDGPDAAQSLAGGVGQDIEGPDPSLDGRREADQSGRSGWTRWTGHGRLTLQAGSERLGELGAG